MSPVNETPLQAAIRWRELWYAAMGHFARMCADALGEDDLIYARRFARRYGQCEKRFWGAWARELVAGDRETQASNIDWFGESQDVEGT